MVTPLFKICFMLATATSLAFGAEEAPAWLRSAANESPASYSKEVKAVVLLKESQLVMETSGRVTSTTRYAVRILSREGRTAAVARTIYQTDTGKIKELRAWLIRRSGEVKKYGKDRVLDLAVVDNDIYNEVRIRSIIAGDDAEDGAVFGYESVSEDKSAFTQYEWSFQESRWPTLLSRYSVTLPQGWSAKSVTFNRATVEPAVEAATTTWEVRQLPMIEDEPAAPNISALSPRLAVSVFPPGGLKGGAGRGFDSWAAVSLWLSELSDSQAASNPVLINKAKELTESAKTEWDRIEAVGRFVQGLNYVSIQTGLGRGGGYRPHAASEVLAKSYGDCKDKANLMRALLGALGITSHLLVIYSGDPTYVREEWPSPQQFNHCIIAIRVGPQIQAPSVIAHPRAGRLLIFDPTDEDTPLGDLPDHEQGSLALLVAGDAGALLRMPSIPPEASHIERRIEATLEPDGSISAFIRERSVGQSAVEERRQFRYRTQSEYVKLIEAWITQGATGAKVSKVAPKDKRREGQFELETAFTATSYGQLMQGRLLVFRPALVPRRDALLLTSSSRKYPIVLRSESLAESVRLGLPTAFVVDELPEPLKVETEFGSYSANYELQDGALLFNRALTLHARILPPENYAEVRKFFGQVGASEVAPVVLVKKP